jgi:hypothetical protein
LDFDGSDAWLFSAALSAPVFVVCAAAGVAMNAARAAAAIILVMNFLSGERG